MANSETSLDRLNQLADQSGRQASELESLASENAALRGRVEGLESQLAALRGLQQDLVGRLEHVLARSGGQERLDALDQRLAASHAATLRTAERVESVAGDVASLGRLTGSIEQTRSDVSQQLAGHQEDSSQAFAELEARVRKDNDALQRAVRENAARTTRLAESLEPIERLDRSRKELADGLNRLSARVEAVAAERIPLEDAVRAAQERADQRIAQLAQVLSEVRSDAQAWQERTQEQAGILRDARDLAERMKHDAQTLEGAHLTSARAQQAHEARMEARLTTWRNAIDEELASFVARHDREREQADREHLAREALRDEASTEARQAIGQRLDAMGNDIGDRLSALVAEGLDLRRQLGEWLTIDRDAAQAMIANLERGGHSEARPALADERRAALRRAVRAQRAGDQDRS